MPTQRAATTPQPFSALAKILARAEQPPRIQIRILPHLRWYNRYIAMRFGFDRAKSREVKRKHGVSLEQAQEIFDQVHLVDQKNDNPEQFRAIGWCLGRLHSVIFEIRYDSEGEYYHLITAWRATREEEQMNAKNV
jgi:uncharacterized DUF497 family protein